MCKKVNTKMAVGYALKDRRSVSADALQKMREELAGYGKGILMDVTLGSLLKVARRYDGTIKVVGEDGTYRIEKSDSKSFPKFFGVSHLRACYGSLYTSQEYKKIVSVLTSA